MANQFHRHPAPGTMSQELEIPASDAILSGLLSEPTDPDGPRAVIMAVHGANMHAGYWDATSAPGLSLLELGGRLGYTVWAPDRPGIGASAGLDPDRIRLFAQAELLLDALEEFTARHRCGAGVVLVGHSYGLKVALAMAAASRGRALLGLDGSGAGVRYAFEWAAETARTAPRRNIQDRAWGPRGFYPEGSISRRSLPLHPMPPAQAEEGGRWPDDIRSMARKITIPIRLTYADHEGLWPIDEEALAEVRETFPNSRRLSIDIEPWAGHNISLGWAARSYHLRVLAFAESLIREHQMG
jgi:pimeloyl-ACP methyl ester carboxylesterase